MITFPDFINELWQQGALRWTCYFTGLGFVWYWLFSAIFENADRQRVIEAAQRFTENKRRRVKDEEAKELWDSVNQLKRGQRQQRHTFTDSNE